MSRKETPDILGALMGEIEKPESGIAVKQESNKYGFMKTLNLLSIVLFFSLNCVNALPERDDHCVEVVSYEEMKNVCFRFICNINDIAKMWDYPDAYVVDVLKTDLGNYLIYLNTTESHKLYLKYEELEWNIKEMIELHLSVDE